jgi:hypothetical protein
MSTSAAANDKPVPTTQDKNINNNSDNLSDIDNSDPVNITTVTPVTIIRGSTSPETIANQLPLKASLLSLLADFLDCSCNGLRDGVEDYTVPDEIGSVIISSDVDSHSHANVESLRRQLHVHLGWLTVFTTTVTIPGQSANDPSDPNDAATVATNSTDVPSSYNEIKVDVAIDSKQNSLNDIDEGNHESINESQSSLNVPLSESGASESTRSESDAAHPTLQSENANVPNVTSIQIYRNGPRLALLPDYRSKILWISALVDEKNVLYMIKNELNGRLKDCFRKYENSELCGMDIKHVIQSEIDVFCDTVIEGVKAVVLESKPCYKID